jgi:hypothetical protein
MSRIPRPAVPPRVPPVEPALLGSAVFLFAEYLAQLEGETPPTDEDEDEEEEEADPEIETSAVLDLFAEELGTTVTVTLTLYLRVTALYRLLSRSPSLAALAMDQESIGGELTEEAVVAAARLDLHVTREGDDGTADFDPREFRVALTTD